MINFKLTPAKTAAIKTMMLRCRGDQAGADSTVKLTINGVDSDTVNIGRSGDTPLLQTFTFTNPQTVISGTEYTVTIT